MNSTEENNDILQLLALAEEKRKAELLKEEEEARRELSKNISLVRLMTFYLNSKEIGPAQVDIIDEFQDVLIKKGLLSDKRDYKSLKVIEEELNSVFPEKARTIGLMFKELEESLRKCSAILNNSIDDDNLKLENLKNEIQDILTEQVVFAKIQNGDFLSEKELDIVKRIIVSFQGKNESFTEKDAINFYSFLVKRNSEIIKQRISQKLETRKKKLQKRKKAITPLSESSQKVVSGPEFLDDDDNYREALKRAKSLTVSDEGSEIAEAFKEIPFSEYNFLLDVCTTDELVMSIPSVIANIVLPSLEENSDNFSLLKDLLKRYDEACESLKKRESQTLESANLNAEDKEKSDDKSIEMDEKWHDFLERIERKDDIVLIEDCINLVESGLAHPLRDSMQGYIQNLKNVLGDIKFGCTSGFFEDNQALYGEEIDKLISAKSDMRRYMREIDGALEKPKDDLEANSLGKEFYQNSNFNNLIVFPGNVDLGDFLEDDPRYTDSEFSKVKNALNKMINDENILTSSNHHVLDGRGKNSKLENLRSYRAGNSRIFYVTSRSSSLSEYFGKRVNLLFIVGLGFGAIDGNAKFVSYSDGKKYYEENLDQIDSLITSLNDDKDDKEIVEFLDEQYSKMGKFLCKCNEKSKTVGKV